MAIKNNDTHSRGSGALVWLAISAGSTILVDQASKFFVARVWPDAMLFNPDIAFSLQVPGWVLIIAIVLLAGVGVERWMSWDEEERTPRAWAVGLVVGGGLANLIDRAVYGGVRDFIDVGFWPVFNLADTALTIGVIGLLWYAVRSSLTSHGKRSQGVTRGQH